MKRAEIGIIGGSGVYNIEGVKVIEELSIDTPFGKPSDKIILCDINGKNVAFLPRHGRGHIYLPTEIPVKANIYALKSLGVNSIIAISAVGSLKQEIKPRDFVVPNQIIDRTKQRPISFFGGGVVGHISFANPFCEELSSFIYNFIDNSGHSVHKDETYLCMEGPLFSSRAESHLYRSWGCGIIGMTAIPEAKLAREAEICYSMIALSTDYDCWNEEEEHVTTEMVIANMTANVKKVKSLLPNLIEGISVSTDCSCCSAAAGSIMTDNALIPDAKKKELSLLYGKYFV